MSAHVRVSATYSGPTETRGSRIIVRWQGRQATYPFNHAARDAFTDSVARALGINEAHVIRDMSRGGDNRRVYTVSCAMPDDNHSNDLHLIAHGQATRLPLCGFHLQRWGGFAGALEQLAQDEANA